METSLFILCQLVCLKSHSFTVYQSGGRTPEKVDAVGSVSCRQLYGGTGLKEIAEF